MSPSQSAFLLWDSEGVPPARAGVVYRWSGYDAGDGCNSVPAHLERHADQFRSMYTRFINDLGQAEIRGKSVVDHLDLGSGVSFWWMTLICEKSPFKSRRIFDCLRLLALEDILRRQKPERLEIVTTDGNLAEAVGRLCSNLGIVFVGRSAHKAIPWSAKRLFHALPLDIQAAVWLVLYLARHWRLRSIPRPSWPVGAKSVLVCSYFLNVSPTEAARGQFQSGYWGPLPRLLLEMGYTTNWIHQFLDGISSPGDARLVTQLNRAPDSNGVHAFLSGYLSGAAVARAIGRWRDLRRVSRSLENLSPLFTPSGSASSFWPLLRADWNTSVRGRVALENALWVELFDAAIGSLPHQDLGLYLSENQGWERAFIAMWRKYGHGRLIGVPHSTIRYWDLRYAADTGPRELSMRNGPPIPDALAINGPAAWEACVLEGYPPDFLVPVEALRYLGLKQLAALRSAKSPASGGTADSRRRIQLLVLGDIFPDATRALLVLLESAMREIPTDLAVTFKPHPANPVNPSDFPGLSIQLVTGPLASLLPQFQIAVAGNCTSSGLEAFIAGLGVIVRLDSNDFNFSPLRGVPGVVFFSSAPELGEALRSMRDDHRSNGGNDAYFWLEADLPRWRQLLSS